MLKKFDDGQYLAKRDELRYRAGRCIAWTYGEGTELEDMIYDLGMVYSLHGIANKDHCEQIVEIMEYYTLGYLVEEFRHNQNGLRNEYYPVAKKAVKQFREQGYFNG